MRHRLFAIVDFLDPTIATRVALQNGRGPGDFSELRTVRPVLSLSKEGVQSQPCAAYQREVAASPFSVSIFGCQSSTGTAAVGATVQSGWQK